MARGIVKFVEPKPQPQRCVSCKEEVLSNAIDPLCEPCTEAAEAAVAEQKARTEELSVRNQLTIQQLEVMKNACAAHGQAVQICDSLLEKFGGPRGFAEKWYADAMLIFADGKKAGTALSQRFFFKFAEYQLAVAKVSGQDLGAIDKYDEEQIAAELRIFEERLEDGRHTA